MSSLSKEQILLSEWNACENTITKFDNILTQIRFFGFTVTVGLMGAAAETLRTPAAIVNLLGFNLHIAVIIEALSVVLLVLFWILHRHYFEFLLLTVDRQREIEEKELLINSQPILKLGTEITRAKMPSFIKDPWRWLFCALIAIGIILTIVYTGAPWPEITA